jgi:hypothetical protein
MRPNDSNMIDRRIGHAPPRARAALLLLVLFTGCGLRSDATADYGARPTAPKTQTPTTPPAAGAVASSTAPAESTAGPLLTGRVVLKRPAPQRRIVNMSKDAECIALHEGEPVLDEDLIVGDGGGLKNAFVYVRRGAPQGDYPIPEKPAVLDQQGCMYHPRVQGVFAGQRVLVGNGDPVTHNVRSFPVLNRPFNFGQPPDTEPRERVFDTPEREIEVQCDFHPWMHAYIFVMDHPFFSVTADDGTYAIPDLPPGEYTLAIWHEKLGRRQQKVVVDESGRAQVDFAY